MTVLQLQWIRGAHQSHRRWRIPFRRESVALDIQKNSADTSKLISFLMLPMHGSVVFRKLGLEVDPAAVAKKQQMQEKKPPRTCL